MVNGRAPSTPPLSAKSANLQPKSSGRTKTKLQNSLEKHPNLSSPYVFDLNTTPSSPTKQGVPTGKSLLVVTIKDKTVKVNMPTDSTPRSPTLVECKAIIKHQQETNKRQEQEVILYLVRWILLGNWSGCCTVNNDTFVFTILWWAPTCVGKARSQSFLALCSFLKIYEESNLE